MKITCDIVKDLMPLYIDNICSNDSRKLIEEHIQNCDNCRKELIAMETPVEYPILKEEGKSKDPFFKIRKKVRIKIVITIIATSLIVMMAMFSVQEIGTLHDFFYPMNNAVIDNITDQENWVPVEIDDSEFLNFSSIFYKKELINDANSSGNVTIRILDENKNVVLKETIIEPGNSINLKFLDNNKNYIVQIKCKEGRFVLNFI